MAKSRLFRILSLVVEIKPKEEFIALLLFSYFFLITASFTIIKSLRNAQYLRTYDAIDLPKAYLLTAVFMAFVVAVHIKLEIKLSRTLLIITSCIFFVISGAVFAFLFLRPWMWVALAFFIWANVFITVLMTQFWIVVNDVFNPREAKRLIGFIGSGGILGGIIGGLSVGLLDLYIHDYLLFIACGLMVVTLFVLRIIFAWQKKNHPGLSSVKPIVGSEYPSPKKVGFKDCFDTVRKNRYLRLLAAVVTVTLIVSTLIDWQYNRVVEVSQKPALYASLFGYFNAIFLSVPFFFQLLMTSNIIKRFGIRITLLVYPIMLLVCSLAIGIVPSLGFALLIKGSDKSLSFSLNQSVRELLFIPVSQQLKYKAKVFIDMFVNRFAKSAAALLLMLVLAIPFKFPPDQEPVFLWKSQITIVSLISFMLILVWVYLNLKVSNEYADTVKGKLVQQRARGDSLVDEKVDIGFMKLVIDSLENKDRSSVLHAMDVFDLISRDKLTPEVRRLISYKENEMRASALGALIEGSEIGIAPEIEEAVDEKAMVAEINEIMGLDVYQKVMNGYMDKMLAEEDKASEIERMEAARSIGFMNVDSPLSVRLAEFLWDESPEVRRQAIMSAARLKRREYVTGLVEAMHNPQTKEDAKAALSEFGAAITGTLADYMGDEDVDREIRSGVITLLGKIGNQEASEYLIWELADNDKNFLTEIIDALDRIRSERQDVTFKEDVVKKIIGDLIRRSCSCIIAGYESDPEGKYLEKDSGKKNGHLTDDLMNIFKLLGLIYSREDIIKAYQNIEIGTKDSVAYAIELLDNRIRKEMKDALFPLIEDLSPRSRLRKCRLLLKNFPIL
ncbi:MAG: hypothetical protein JXB23_01130 [Candidatus Aminicenantes bacterium]|nr:hypothetical protein [Candidatus Aminicenantes bacterium]